MVTKLIRAARRWSVSVKFLLTYFPLYTLKYTCLKTTEKNMLRPRKTAGAILHPYLPIPTSQQQPLSSLLKVAVVERCDCVSMMVLPISFMQVKSALAAKEKLEKTRGEDMERVSKQNKQREEKLAKLLQETETRHSEFTCNLSRWLSLLDHTNREIAPCMDHTCS